MGRERERKREKERKRKYGRERVVERETGLVVRLERGWKCEGCTSCKREINKLERPIKSVPAVATNSLPFTRIHLFSLFLLPPSRPARIREGGRKIMPVPWPLSRAELRYWVALLDARSNSSAASSFFFPSLYACFLSIFLDIKWLSRCIYDWCRKLDIDKMAE